MKYFLLIYTLLMVISVLNPSNLKLKTFKEQVDQLLIKNDNKKEPVLISLLIGLLVSIIYCILLAVYIKSFVFTVVMTYWIAQTIFEFNFVTKYIDKKVEDKFLTSWVYKWGSRIVDFGIYGYIIYFIMMNW